MAASLLRRHAHEKGAHPGHADGKRKGSAPGGVSLPGAEPLFLSYGSLLWGPSFEEGVRRWRRGVPWLP